MSKDILEVIENGISERPLKGLLVDKTLYIYDTKQELIEEQAISNKRVAGLVAWAKDIAKFVVFSEDGSTFEEKDFPSGSVDLSGYVEKYTRADLDYLRCSYGGKYDDERVFHPVRLNQDSNGWTQLGFTGYMQFQSYDKATGEAGEKVLELRNNRVINKVQPYYNDDKISVRSNSHISNTSSLSDMINPENINITEWIESNPDYTPSELLEQIFTSKVVGFLDWQAEITLSAQDYNGTLPIRYGKWVIRRSNDSTRDYMYAHSKESEDVYRAPYINGSTPVWSLMAYVSDIDEVVDDRISSIFNPSPPTDITLKNPEFSDYGYSVSYGSMDYNGEYIRFPRWSNTISESVHYSGLNSSYILFRVEDISRMIGRDLDQNDNELGIDLTTTSGGLGRYGTPLPSNNVLGAKWDYSGRAIAKLIPNQPDGSSDGTEQDANDPYLYLKEDGSTTEDKSEAKSATYTAHKLKKIDSFLGRKWGFALRRGYITKQKSFEYNSESNYYVCAFNIQSPIEADKHHTFNFDLSEAKIYESLIDAEMSKDEIMNKSAVIALIEESNQQLEQDQLMEGLASGFIYAKSAKIG